MCVTKNDHLTHLLGQTDACLRTLASRLRRSLRKALEPACAAAADPATSGFAPKGKGLALSCPKDLPSQICSFICFMHTPDLSSEGITVLSLFQPWYKRCVACSSHLGIPDTRLASYKSATGHAFSNFDIVTSKKVCISI